MRIIAGSRKSIRLMTPKGMHTRPTMDRTKETLFNIISTNLPGSRFLDLFSGSGAVGLEALSRGAEYVILVEKDRAAANCIKDNIRITKFELQARLMNVDTIKALAMLELEQKQFDIIFMDPPFNKQLETEVMIKLSNSTLLHEDTLIIIEASEETDFNYLRDLGFIISRIKSYKTHKHVFVCPNKNT